LAFHICQVGWFCFGLQLHALQLTDHFMVYTALLWFSLYFASEGTFATEGTAERLRMSITLSTMAVTLPVIASFIGTWMSGAIVVAITIVLTALMFSFVFILRGAPRFAWPSLFVALLLLAAGVVLHVFGGDYGPDNWVYPAAHSVWHIMAMLSLFWIIDIPYKDKAKLRAQRKIEEQSRVQQRWLDSRNPKPAQSTREHRSISVQQQQGPGQKKTRHGSKRVELPQNFLFDDSYSTFL
jgi:hypothetical protein